MTLILNPLHIPTTLHSPVRILGENREKFIMKLRKQFILGEIQKKKLKRNPWKILGRILTGNSGGISEEIP